MEFKQYPSYKKSGVEWLGDVPEHWQIVRTKDIFNHRKEEALEDDEIVTAFRDGQVTLRKNRRTDGFTNSIKEHGYQHINNGDLVIHEMDAFAGAIGVSDSSGKSTPVYTVCYAKNENINHHFYSHFFRTMAKTGFINSLAKGIRVRSTEFRWNESRNVYLAEPPKADQEKIVSFLDTETARIDNLIAKQEKLIELLEEQRKSIISHAVTKGLNPDAPMKDSGVEWLGEVPEHWQILKLRQLVKLESGSALPLDRINPDGKYPVYGGNNIRGFTENFNMKGDYILVGRQGSLCGNINYASGEFWATEHAVVVYPKKPVSLTFLGELLRTMNLNQYSIASAQAGLLVDRISNIYTIYIPFEEQIQIAKKIDHENLKLDKLIDKQKMLIEKLKEYRSSVISYAVTGKIDVREFDA